MVDKRTDTRQGGGGYVVTGWLTPGELRRLCELVDSGRAICQVAAEAGVARQTLGKWHARWKQTYLRPLMREPATAAAGSGASGRRRTR